MDGSFLKAYKLPFEEHPEACFVFEQEASGGSAALV